MFEIKTQEGLARTGKLHTAHGIVETPFYMPVLTKGCAKHISHDELYAAGTNCAIANAFILYLKPGMELIYEKGGIHKFINWKKSLFTDSGGFQMLSSDFLISADDKGVLFRSPFDGTKHIATPERVMEIEQTIGADVAMALDDVPHYGNSKEYISDSVRRTHLWAKRCLDAHTQEKQLLFGICQGGTFPDLREKSAKFFGELSFDGLALGGLCIGEDKELMQRMIDITIANIPKEKPRYLMGVGSPQDMVDAIGRGMDIFDSVFPTQNARHGGLFTINGRIDLTKRKYALDESPIEENCSCYSCTQFTKAYIHHLLQVKEPFGFRLATIHNIHFVQHTVSEAKNAITENRFDTFRKEFLSSYK